MQNELREIIYDHFSKFGIKGRHRSTVISLNIDLQSGELKENDSENFFEPDLKEFGILDQLETNKLVLDYIYESTQIRLSSVNEISTMSEIDKKPFLLQLNEYDRDNLKYYIATSKIPGSLVFRNKDRIESLGIIEEIDGDLGFSDSYMRDLGNLIEVSGNIWIAQEAKTFTELKTLGNLEFVGGDLSIKKSPIESLGNLMHVGGNLNLRQTKIKNLGKLKSIGKSLLLPSKLKNVIDISNVIVKGKIKFFNDNE